MSTLFFYLFICSDLVHKNESDEKIIYIPCKERYSYDSKIPNIIGQVVYGIAEV